MPRPEPHPLALFSLIPKNERAERVVTHQCNDHLVSRLSNGKFALDIGHVRPMSGDRATLATLGRTGDVVVEGSSIAKIQASFEIDLDTKVVMFYDRSHGQTSQVFGENTTPFEYGRLRKVVVQEKVNTIIGMGGVGRNLVQFELKWHSCSSDGTVNRDTNRKSASLEENPRLARTIDAADTVLPSERETRLHTPGPQQPKRRYVKLDELGSGQFGDVYKAVDVDSGKLMAVKILKRPVEVARQQEWRTLKREVEILSSISHPHIVDYITSQGWDERVVEILMGLKEGTLQSLVERGCSTPTSDLAYTVFHHTLQAIDFLAKQGIVHRDVKPENILYTSQQDKYHFQLGDFGLSNRAKMAVTSVGTGIYMAPEMYQNGKQTHKVDVWSLFVTMLWTLDVGKFRDVSTRFNTFDDARKVILAAASNEVAVSAIREMARIDPEERASAAQMLVKCYDGQGLSTPRNEVSPISLSKDKVSTGNADNKAPAAVGTTSPGLAQPKTRDIRKNATRAAGQFRIDKFWVPQTQLRQPGRLTEKRGVQLRPRSPGHYRVPGRFPEDTIDTLTDTRKRPNYT